ncbi:unnamed protein product [Albugo candida]|uniref:Uncharacterized protein n=1 Tax=Albugo candida TaxID=65357 RepID=A0A024G1V4_9STRA|nr:unnamed protein product [Albugo candida]|eukprot:CCI40526.1 unnamed protein product [Albugo candida]
MVLLNRNAFERLHNPFRLCKNFLSAFLPWQADSPPAFSCFLRAVASWFQRAPQKLGIEARDPSNAAINNAIGYSHNQSHILQIEPVRSQNPESHPARSIQRRKSVLGLDDESSNLSKLHGNNTDIPSFNDFACNKYSASKRRTVQRKPRPIWNSNSSSVPPTCFPSTTSRLIPSTQHKHRSQSHRFIALRCIEY